MIRLEAASHANKGWEQFTAAVLRVVTSRLAPTSGESSKSANGVVFMAWGSHAQKMCSGVDKVGFCPGGHRRLQCFLRCCTVDHPVPDMLSRTNTSFCALHTQVHWLRTRGSSETAISKRRMSGWKSGMVQVEA